MSNLQKYHVSKNLFFQKITKASINANGGIIDNSSFDCFVAEIKANEQYICTGLVYAFYINAPTYGSQAYNNQRVVVSAITSFTAPIDGYIVVRYNVGTSNAMLNEGTTILPYEPYSADVWHDLAPQQYINDDFVDNANIPEKYSGGSWS